MILPQGKGTVTLLKRMSFAAIPCAELSKEEKTEDGCEEDEREERERQGHQKEDMTTEEKLENDEEKREKEMEHEICVVTWNVNNSSAHYDFLL